MPWSVERKIAVGMGFVLIVLLLAGAVFLPTTLLITCLSALLLLGAALGGCYLIRRTTRRHEQAEAAWHESEQRFRAIYEGSHDAIMLLNADGFLDCNSRTLEIFGFQSKEEFVGTHPADVSPPFQPDGQDSRAAAQDRIQTAFRERRCRFDWMHRRRSGEDFPAEVLLSAFVLGGQTVLQASVRDITERKRAEEELRKLSRAVEQSPASVVITDVAGDIEYVNPKFTQVTGYTLEEARGKNPRILKSGEQPPEVYKQLWETITSGREWRGEFHNKKKNGELYWEYASISPVKNAQGTITHFLAVKEDITEGKRAEEELRRAKEVAETATRAKSEFLANMSHEIRTPMNAIIGMSELALDTDLTSEQREYLTTVTEAANSLLNLINDILDFSKIEAGKFGLESIEFDLRDSLGEKIKTLALRAHQKGLELAWHVQPDVPEVLRGDPTRLGQILINLVGNAVKFTEQGEVVVHVETESRTQEEVVLHFAVRDTGIGIPQDRQQLIFEAFAQADGSMSRRYGGTGLGLTISSQLVGMMDGRIWVESEVGKGSTFHFTARFGVPTAPAAKKPPEEPVRFRNMPVLVVDDNATNRRILEELLTHWEMKPTLADGGFAALAEMERAKEAGEPFPLVLTDAQMPDMDGFTLVERIKQDPALAGATIMMLTSAGQRGDAARCRELGVAAYLIKPIKQSELRDAFLVTLRTQARKAMQPVLITRHSLRESRRYLHILLVEDNPFNQQLVTRLLGRSAHTVVVASNGKEALAALGQDRFDLVLMDVQMPEMDGLEATAAIREKERESRAHIPIVAMTAHALRGDRERCLAAGMDGYVSKPIQAQELFEMMEGLLPAWAETQAALPAEMPEDEFPAADKVVDKDLALSFVEGDAKLLGEIIQLFFQDGPKQLTELRECVARRDTRTLERSAHTLKGSVRYFGAQSAAKAAQRLEMMGRESNLNQAEEALRALEKEIERLMPALEDLKKELAN